MHTIRFALIGCGRIAANHQRALQELGEKARLVAVCDTDGSRAASLAATCGAEAYTDYVAMLARADVDAVCICTPSGLHPEHGIAAARAGKHVITEKPMAIRLEDCDALIKACDQHHRHLSW